VLIQNMLLSNQLNNDNILVFLWYF